jgi:hypothetical protein
MTPIETTPGLLRQPEGAASAFPLVGVAEDAGFEPARAVNPTRFPSERHRPLGESSARKVTGNHYRGRTVDDRRVTGASLSGEPVCRTSITLER